MYDNDSKAPPTEIPSKQIWATPEIHVLTLCETTGGLTNDAETDGGFMGS